MTIPHLMNCRHSDSGWCIPCVKKLHDSLLTAFDYMETAKLKSACKKRFCYLSNNELEKIIQVLTNVIAYLQERKDCNIIVDQLKRELKSAKKALFKIQNIE